MSIEMPDVLYHGTNTKVLNLMTKSTGFINKNYWLGEKDFGPAFYTTSSYKQAKKFARRNAKLDENQYSNPCVLRFKCRRIEIENMDYSIFLGPSLKWAALVHEYRIEEKRDQRDIVFGPLADNKIEGVISECKREEKGKEWLYEQIIKGEDDKNIQDFDDQLVFCNEDIAKQVLTVEGWYTFTKKGGWRYNDSEQAELL
ncbi:DUF3990 domain-containing protein [Halobacillus litoralis]|uniref:DUF3990 domain-containing protein n=1 Tax=Halobacillus litoralis TaxID=45668 RepID=UPI001CD2D92F|nr:DUF3990 domain-containing protein [Halobacillus litoralis]MCA1023608.1 DUF3990 domain-containing protein [Halobacillus litoralis]